MGDWIIKSEGLGKKYQIRHQVERPRYVALRDVIAERATRLFRSSRKSSGRSGAPGGASKQAATEEFWALNDVSFEIAQGEVVGIIGRNGAGKSTLLKILSRITEPTEGRVTLRGRVASLLEVGTGFHPELTGRENIYLNGSILGMSRSEIRKKFDEIVEFAEIEKFLDTSVKRFSSGMYVRLAFAVAAHLEPDILIVDEVLAVGDTQFQNKCLGKMENIASGGRTVLFVSHNMGAVRRICKLGMLMNCGFLDCTGPVDDVLNRYLGVENSSYRKLLAPINGDGVSLKRATIEQDNNLESLALANDGPMRFVFEGETTVDYPSLNMGVLIRNAASEIVWHGASSFLIGDDRKVLTKRGRWTIMCELPAYAMNCGHYAVSVAIDQPHVRMVMAEAPVLSFEILPTCPVMSAYPADACKGVIGPGLGKWRVLEQNSITES